MFVINTYTIRTRIFIKFGLNHDFRFPNGYFEPNLIKYFIENLTNLRGLFFKVSFNTVALHLSILAYMNMFVECLIVIDREALNSALYTDIHFV